MGWDMLDSCHIYAMQSFRWIYLASNCRCEKLTLVLLIFNVTLVNMKEFVLNIIWFWSRYSYSTEV